LHFAQGRHQRFPRRRGVDPRRRNSFLHRDLVRAVLLIVIAIAGLVYGQEAAQGAITTQLGDLMGRQTAELLQTAVASSKSKSSGFLAAAVGIVTLVVAASGVFGEMQAALNKIWKAESKGTTVGRLVRARAKSLGLVAALGFLLMVS